MAQEFLRLFSKQSPGYSHPSSGKDRSDADHRKKRTASALSNYKDADNQSLQGEKSFQITFQNALYILKNCFSLLKPESRYLQRHTGLLLGHFLYLTILTHSFVF